MRRATTMLGLATLAAMAVGPALAQTTTTTTTTPASTEGAFDRLSPGNQKIAQALFDAQVEESTTAGAPKPLTLDEIAAMKQGGSGWGRVFKDMKAQGLVTQKNLGQVVSGSRRTTTTGGVITTASGKVLSRPGAAPSKHHADGDDGTGAVSAGGSSASGKGHGNAHGGTISGGGSRSTTVSAAGSSSGGHGNAYGQGKK